MNLKKSLLMAALPVLFLTACKQNDSAASADAKAETASVAAEPETASFKIDGMVCAVGCAKTIEKKLASLDGVTKVSVDYDKKEATVEFDAAKQTPEQLVETVEKVGDGKTYKVSDLKASGNHAAVFVSHEKEKEKDKKKSKKDKKAAAGKSEKKEGCSESKEAKAGCCAKKNAHSA
ncbi:heavy-metal-associated domain-containing protein [Flavobacterium selenitireducens]|uniref:heavy-metal-associated domain-containing protein n=1 Tax=Flavobacterium selenitireducens TaxID=2722704 RepID=UPI00168AE9C0|nr:heavy-metal-associated domain-containing protein [Flavobacterium selenitireducens]MBD3582311.1 heavy-metal-associated domain-containing protein [Flavobacterium selenitireducens]